MYEIDMENKVLFSEVAVPLHHPSDPGKELGMVVSRTYEGENVVRHEFQTEERSFALSPTTSAFKFYDWTDVFAPLFDAGYELDKLDMIRGGLQVAAVLKNPQVQYADPIDWDVATWGKGTYMTDSILVNAGVSPGSGLHFRRGFFRLVCTNGMVVETLGLGRGDYNHITFDAGKLVESLFNTKVRVTGDRTDLLGARIGYSDGLKMVKRLVTRVTDKDDELEGLPPFTRQLIAPLRNLSVDFGEVLNDQLDAIVGQSANEIKVYELDIANALTSAQNIMRRDESLSMSAVFATQAIQRSLVNLTGVYSL